MAVSSGTPQSGSTGTARLLCWSLKNIYWMLGKYFHPMFDAASMKSPEIEKQLLGLLGEPGTPERGGFVLNDGSLMELANASDTPMEGAFLNPTPEQLQRLPDAIGTWHTHPGATANLSVGDFETFVGWPAMTHAIVGTDGVRWYAVKNNAVINA